MKPKTMPIEKAASRAKFPGFPQGFFGGCRTNKASFDSLSFRQGCAKSKPKESYLIELLIEFISPEVNHLLPSYLESVLMGSLEREPPVIFL